MILLRNLPCKPEQLFSQYLPERQQFIDEKDPRQILRFTSRWKALWDQHAQLPLPVEERIRDQKFDPREALRCLNSLLSSKDCEHTSKSQACEGFHIALPICLLDAILYSHQSKGKYSKEDALFILNGGRESLDPSFVPQYIKSPPGWAE